MQLKKTLSIIVLFGAAFLSAQDLSLAGKLWKVSHPKKVQFETDKKSVRLENDARTWKMLDLDPNTKYVLTYYVKGENIANGKNQGALIAINAGGKWKRITSRFNNELETGTFDWKMASGIIDTSDFSDNRIRFELNLRGKGTVWFKDLKIVKKNSESESTDLSNALTIDPKLSGWTVSSIRNVAVDDQIKIGAQSVRLENGGRVWKTLNLEPNTQYELTFYIKGKDIENGKNQGARIAINAGKRWERITAQPKNNPDVGTFDWKKGSGIIDTGRFPNSRLRIELLLMGKGTVWYDELKITKKKIKSRDSISFYWAYADAVKSAALVPHGVFGFFKPGEPIKLQLLIDGKAKNYEYTLLVKDDTGKTVVKQEKKALTKEILLPAQPCGYYAAESIIYADGKKAYKIQGGFAVSPIPGKRDPFFQFGYGVIARLHDGYKRIGCGSISLKLDWLALKPDPIYYRHDADLFPRTKRIADYELANFKPYLESKAFKLTASLPTSLNRSVVRSTDELAAGYPMLNDRLIKTYLDYITYMQPKLKIKEWCIGQETPSNAKAKWKYVGTWSESMGNFVTLARMGSRLLRKLDPEIKIYAGTTSGVQIAKIEMGDILQDFDIYYINAYTGNWDLYGGGVDIPEIGQKKIYQRASELSVSLGKGKYIANEETGYSINYGAPFDSGLAWDQARLTARSMIISKASPVIHYQLYRPNDYWLPKDDSARHMATVWKSVKAGKKIHYVPLPGGAMFATIASELAFAKFAGEIISGNIYCYIFSKPDGSTVVALWNIDKEQPFDVKLPSVTRIVNLFGRDITKKPLSISPDPIYIVLQCPAADAVDFMQKAVSGNGPEFICSAFPGTIYVRSLMKETRDAEIRLSDGKTFKVKILPGKNNIFNLPVAAPCKLIAGSRMYDVPMEKIKIHKLKRISSMLEIRKGKPGLLHYPDHIRPLEALQPERNFFKTKDYNPNGHSVSAQYWTAYDDQNFYLVAEVDDPVHLQRHTGKDIWRDDCLQFVLSPEDYPPASILSSLEKKPSSEYNFGLALTPKGTQLVKFLGKDKGIKNYPAKVFRKGNTTVYEVAIPWNEVGGKAKRFGFIIFDNNNPVQDSAPYWLEFSPGIAHGEDSSKLAKLVYE